MNNNSLFNQHWPSIFHVLGGHHAEFWESREDQRRPDPHRHGTDSLVEKMPINKEFKLMVTPGSEKCISKP